MARHCVVRTKGALSQGTVWRMAFKLAMATAKLWRRLRGGTRLPEAVRDVTFRNSIKAVATPVKNVAQPRRHPSPGVVPPPASVAKGAAGRPRPNLSCVARLTSNACSAKPRAAIYDFGKRNATSRTTRLCSTS